MKTEGSKKFSLVLFLSLALIFTGLPQTAISLSFTEIILPQFPEFNPPNSRPQTQDSKPETTNQNVGPGVSARPEAVFNFETQETILQFSEELGIKEIQAIVSEINTKYGQEILIPKDSSYTYIVNLPPGLTPEQLEEEISATYQDFLQKEIRKLLQQTNQPETPQTPQTQPTQQTPQTQPTQNPPPETKPEPPPQPTDQLPNQQTTQPTNPESGTRNPEPETTNTVAQSANENVGTGLVPVSDVGAGVSARPESEQKEAEIKQKIKDFEERLKLSGKDILTFLKEENAEEIIEERTETSKHFKTQEGFKKALIYSSPIHYQDDRGKFQEIDNNLILDPNDSSGKVKNKAGLYQVSFATEENNPDFMTFQIDGKELTLIPEGFKNPQGSTREIKDNSIIYHEVDEGIDLKYQTLTGSVKEEIILNKYTGKNSFSFKINTQGLTYQKEEGGRISFLDQNGKKVFTIPPLVVYDSARNFAPSDKVNLDISSRDNSFYINIEVAKDWLEDLHKKFPIIIDPHIEERDSSGDAWISNWLPNTTGNGPSETHLYVGTPDPQWGIGTAYALIKFAPESLTPYRDKHIYNATFTIYAYPNKYNPNTPVWLNVTVSPWDPNSVTWNTQPISWSHTSAYVWRGWDLIPDDLFSFDVTNPIYNWANGLWNINDNGFLLHANGNGGAYYKEFVSSEGGIVPYIEIDYNSIPSIMSLASPAPLEVVRTAQPAFSWYIFDADRDPVDSKLEIFGPDPFSDWVRWDTPSNYPSSTKVDFPYSAVGFLPDGYYEWRIEVSDGADINGTGRQGFTIAAKPTVTGMWVNFPQGSARPTFNWSISDPDNNAPADYIIEIKGLPGYLGGDPGAVTSYTATDPWRDGNYSWRVQVMDAVGNLSDWSGWQGFTIAAGPQVGAGSMSVSSLGPDGEVVRFSDNDKMVKISKPTLSFTVSDPDSSVLTVSVEVATDASFPQEYLVWQKSVTLPNPSLNAPISQSFLIEVPLPPGKYYWRIKVYDDLNETTSEVRNFIIETDYNAQVSATPTTLPANTLVIIPLTIKNTGTKTWYMAATAAAAKASDQAEAEEIYLSHQWFDSSGVSSIFVEGDNEQTPLPYEVPPNQTVYLNVTVKTPTQPGPYTLKWDLKNSAFAFSSHKGVPPKDISITIQDGYNAQYSGRAPPVLTTGEQTTLDPALPTTISLTVTALTYTGGGILQLFGKWLNERGEVVKTEGPYSFPGINIPLYPQVTAPNLPGIYTLKFDLSDGSTSFSEKGVSALNFPIAVSPLGRSSSWPFEEGVNLFSGNLVLGNTDAAISGRGPDLVVSRTYNSQSSESGVFGRGWTGSFETKLVEGSIGGLNYIQWKTPDGGSLIFYKNPDGTYQNPPGVYLTLTKNADLTYTIKTKGDTKINFNSNGRLINIIDKNGNTLTYTYNVSSQLTTITDASGRQLTLTYDAANRIILATQPPNNLATSYTYDTSGNLAQVTFDPAGLNLTITYGYDSNNRLISLTNAENETTTYEYDSQRRISAIIEPPRTPNSELRTTFIYDPDNRVTTVTDPNGNPTTYKYNNRFNLTQITSPLAGEPPSNLVIYYYWDNSDNLLATATSTQETIYEYDNGGKPIIKGNQTAVIAIDKTTGDILPSKTSFDEFDNPEKSKDAKGNAVTVIYDSKGNPINTIDSLGNTQEIRYDQYGNVIEVTDSINPVSNLILNSYIKNWLINGPHPNADQGMRLSKDYLGGEANIIPTPKSISAERVWKSYSSPTNYVNLDAFFGNQSYSSAYAHSYIYASSKTQAQLWLGSDDGIKVFLNGQNIYTNDVYRGPTPDSDKIPITLQAGWNRLLLKISEGGGGWGFYARIVDVSGNPIKGLFSSVGESFGPANLVENPGAEFDADSNGSPDNWSYSFNTWTPVAGTWTLENGELKGVGAGGNIDGWIYTGSDSWTDYTLEGKAIFETGNAEFVFRSTGHWQNGYRLEVWSQNSPSYPNKIDLIRYKAGASTVLFDQTSPVPVTNPAQVKIELKANNIKVYLNNTLVLNYTDSDPLLTGRIGLGVIWDWKARFDDVRVTNTFDNTVFFDDFDFNTWTPISGSWVLENGELSATGTSSNQVSWISNVTLTDYIIETKAKALNDGQFWFGFQFRATSQADGYGVWLTNVENALRFTKITSIGNFQVIKDFPYTPVKDTWYTLKVIANGSTFDFYLNNQYLGSASDTSFLAGKAGLLIWHTTHAHFDEVKVTPLGTVFEGTSALKQTHLVNNSSSVWYTDTPAGTVQPGKEYTISAWVKSDGFFDNFSDNDASDWTPISGLWQVENGELKGVGAGGAIDGWIYSGSDSWSDYTLEAKTSFITGEADFVFRSTGHWQNEYRLTLWSQNSSYAPNRIGLAKFKNGTGVGLVDIASPTPITNPAQVKIELRGSNIKVYLNNNLVLDYSDPDPHLRGKVGLGVIWDWQAKFDEVKVTVPGGTGGARLWIAWTKDGVNFSDYGYSSFVQTGGKWRLITLTAKAPANADRVRIHLEQTNFQGSTWFDAVKVQERITTTYEYDALGNYPIKVTDPLGNVTEFTYDAVGNLLTQTILDPSLVGFWHLDEGHGTTAKDSTSNANNATIYGATWANGKSGQALSFDGVDDYVEIPHSNSLDLTDQLTIEAWVKLSSLGKFQILINKSFYNLNGWRVFVDGSNKINLEVINGIDYLVTSNDPLDTNWHHLVFTYDGLNGKIYQDGQELWAYLPHDDLSPVKYYGDAFSDSNGNRVFPWGIEIWAGNPTSYFDGPRSYFDGGQVRLIGDSPDDANVLAIPGYSTKPIVKEGLNYTQSFEVKLDNVQGNGMRIIHQWFDANQNIIGTDFGPFETGTSDWHLASLTKTAPPGAVRGDIIIELYGSGTLYTKNPKFYLTDSNARKITTNTQSLTFGETTDHFWKLEGLLDEVRIYNRALSAQEIQTIYTSGNISGSKERTTTYTYDTANRLLSVTAPLTDLDYADITSPSTNFYLKGITGDNGWYQGDVALTLVATDNSGSSGLTTYYQIDGGLWNTYALPFTITKEGPTNISYYSQDLSGNTETIKFLTLNIDATPPETTIISSPSGTVTTAEVSFTWTGSDNLTPATSLLYSYKLEGYDLNWSSWSSSTSKSYSFLTPGKYTFYVRAKDEAGNVDLTSAENTFTVLQIITSAWTQTTQQDFVIGTATNIDATSSGDLQLSKASYLGLSDSGGGAWSKRRKITITEPDVYSRINAPVRVNLTFNQGVVASAINEIRVVEGEAVDSSKEVPHKVANEVITGGWVTSATITFLVNMAKGETKTYYIYYGNPQALAKSYPIFTNNTALASGAAVTEFYSRQDLPPGLDAYTLTTRFAVGDDTNTLKTLPFSFNYFGVPRSSWYISSNGFMSQIASNDYSNTATKFKGSYNGMIAPAWDDLRTDVGPANPGVYENIYPDRVVYTWRTSRYGYSSQHLIFQAVLYKSGDIMLRYEIIDSTGDINTYQTAGISKGNSLDFLTNTLAAGVNTTPTFFYQYAEAYTLSLGSEEEGFALNGTFISSLYDTGRASDFETISWVANIPSGTSVKFQIGANNDNSTWNFLGPDGTSSTYYLTSGSSIFPGHNGYRYLKYKAYLETSSSTQTPVLSEVGVSYKQTATPPDTNPPTTTSYVKGVFGDNGWYQGDVTLTLVATDNSGSSGLTTYYQIDGGLWNTYALPFTITKEGQTNVSYYSRDLSGNTETIKFLTLNIDATPPETTIISSPSGTVTTAEVSFTWTGSDNLTPATSLLYSYKLEGYDLNWSSWSSSTSKSYSSLTPGGYTFYVRAKDEAGNVEVTAVNSFVILTNATYYVYDKAGRIVKVTGPKGNITTRTYYPGGLLKTETDALGVVDAYEYDKNGNLVKTVEDFGDTNVTPKLTRHFVKR